MILIGFGLDEDVRSVLAAGGLCLVTVTDAYEVIPLDTDGRLTLCLVVPEGDASPESLLPVLAREGRAALSRDHESADVVHIEHRADGLSDDLGQMGMPAAFILG